MAFGTLGSTLNDELNRLANGGTYRDMDDMVDEALAAKQWANRENIVPYSTDTVGILNEIAALGPNRQNWFDFNGVCNYLAGTTGLPAAAALRQITTTGDILTSLAAFYTDAAYPMGLSNTPGYVYLNGATGNYMSTPDASVLDITGDIDLRAQVALDDWTPTADSTILSKWATSNISYALNVNTTGVLGLYYSSNGSTIVGATSTVATGFNDGSLQWIRVTRASASGQVIFYTSTDGNTWTQLGSTIAATSGSIFSGTAPLDLGRLGTGSNFTSGKIYRVQVLSGISGTTVFDANMANVSITATSFIESSSNAATVTINGFRAVPQTVDNLGSAGSLLPVTVGSSLAADSNDPKFLAHTGTNYLYSPGRGTSPFNSALIEDGAALDITGDITLIANIAADSWASGSTQRIISKGGYPTENYSFAISATGTLIYYFNNNGAWTSKQSTAFIPFSAGQAGWVKATLDVDNGASGYDIKFYTSTNGTTWTQLGTTITTAGVATPIANNSKLSIMGDNNASEPVVGKIYRAQIFSDITETTKVLDIDTSVITSGADTYVVPTTYTGQAGAYFTGSGLSLNGVAGNYVSTPDSTALDITGDIDIQVKVAMTDWTPAASESILLSKTASDSYTLNLLSTGVLRFQWVTSAVATLFSDSTVSTGITDGATKWIRVTLDVNNGASGNTTTFYTSDDGTNWTVLGSPVVKAGTTDIRATTGPLNIGAYGASGTLPAAGTFYRAIVKSGIDGYAVFDADFTQVPANALRMTESSINKAVVTLATTRYATINRSTSGRKTVAVTQPTWLFGTDDYMEVNNRYMAHTGSNYLYLPGINGNYASAPDSAALDITGDIDLRVKLAMDDWTPSAVSLPLGKVQTTSQRSYWIEILTNGRINLNWSTTGSNVIAASSTVAPTVTDGSTLWIRVTLDVDNGAAGNTATFFTSNDGITWTTLGSPVVTAGVTSIFNSTSILEIGSGLAGTYAPLRGKIFRAQVLNGIGGTVAFDANFEGSITSINQASFTESSSNAATVTINRSGSTYRSAGVIDAGYLYPGATNTFSNSTTDFLNFGATDSFTVLTISRRFGNPATDQRIVMKWTLGAGYYSTYTTTGTGAFNISGGGGSGTAVPLTLGTLNTIASIRNVSTDLISMTSGASINSASDTTTGSLSTVANFAIGRQNFDNSLFADMEFIGAAVFRSVLTPAQIRQISNYFANREAYL